MNEYVEAQEMGARSSKLINGATINKVLDYQMGGGRSNTLPSKFNNDKHVSDIGDTGKCSYCGRQGHGKSPSLDVRKDKCRAWGKSCNKCSGETQLFNMFSEPSRPAHKRH